MDLSLKDLLSALPEEVDRDSASPQQALQELIQKLSRKTMPLGALNRLWVLGTLQAKIAAAYLFHWFRSGYGDADEKQRRLNETHLKAAMKLLGGMSYLRGAVMKVGQVIANYPDVLPEQFTEVLGRLHFDAPPMHFSLLREMVRNELGADPENLFDGFETEAFAAASLGQVHRARIKGTTQKVAVKIQYPNIARTIRDDMRNMRALLLPIRIGRDWENIQEQFEDVQSMLDMEVDYEQEARNLEVGRAAFREEDGVVVPRVYRELSTKRVLTMEYIDGVHLDAFLSKDPSQDDRNHFGLLIVRSAFHLSYGSNMLHADPHPGNYFFMPDGRLGFIDFGCCRHYTQEELDYMCRVERAMRGPEEDLRQAMALAADLRPEQERDDERMRLYHEWCEWVWKPLLHDGPYDFGDPGYFRRGVELYGELIRKRYLRSRPVNTWLSKNFFGIRALLSRLKSNVDMGAAWKAETWVK